MFRLVKLLRSWLLTLIVVFSIASCASRQKTYDHLIQHTFNHLSSLYKKGPRPWPEFNLLDHSIVFVSPKEKLIKRIYKGQLEELNFDLWSGKIPSTDVTFDTLRIERQPVLVLHLDNFDSLKSETLISTIIQAGFQYFGQAQWKYEKETKGRGIIYPIEAIPRYYRWEMQDHLRQYLKTKDSKHLQIFSYWFQKWKVHFKEEYNSNSDQLEGTARYYNNQMISRYQSENGGTQNNPIATFEASKADNFSFRKVYNLTYESAVLGTLSGLILDHLADTSWHKEVAQGLSPLEALAKKFKPQRDQVNHKEQNEYIAASIRKMEKLDLDGQLDQIISDLANTTKPKVAISSWNLKFTSFSSKGLYRSLFNFPGVEEVKIVHLASHLNIQGDKVGFSFKPDEYWVTAEHSPCGQEHSTLFTLPKESVGLVKGRLKTSSPKFDGLPAKEVRLGKTLWFCVNFNR